MNSIVENTRAEMLAIAEPYRKPLNSKAVLDFSAALESELFIEFGEARFSLLITSPNRHEGKTLTTLLTSLLPSLYADSRTLIIDACHDFSTIKALGLSPDRKLHLCKDFSETVLNTSIRPTSYSNIDVCQVFSATKQTQFLPYRNLSKLHSAIKGDYDRIIVDSMAASESNDYMALAQLFEHVLIVTEHRKTRRHQLQSQLEKLSKANCQVIGSILNKRKYSVPKWLYGN